MTPETIKSYKAVFAECLTSIGEQVIPEIIQHLETIQDDAAAVRSAREDKKPGAPSHWITLLQFIKLGLVVSGELKAHYDELMGTYQTLTGRESRDENENKMLTEVGEFLYATDEATGDLDRINLRLMKSIRNEMIDQYGIVLHPNEAIYADRIPDENFERLAPMIQELTGCCDRLLDLVRVMSALLRMQKFILSE
jgi:hypothetical protein